MVSPQVPNLVIQRRLAQSSDLLDYFSRRLHGLRIARPVDEKAARLACACWHIGLEHHQGVVTLVREDWIAPSLALLRPMFDSYVRGCWLMYAASKKQVESATRDTFLSMTDIVQALEKAAFTEPGGLSDIKTDWWPRLSSYTHTGWLQIASRFTIEGIGYNNTNAERIGSLGWADSIALLCATELARTAQNQQLVDELLARLSGAAPPDE